MAEFDPDKPPSFIGFEHDGWDEDRFAKYIEATNHPDMEAVTRPSIELKEKGTQLTRTMRQMDPPAFLENSAAGPFWARADIGPRLISRRPMEGGGISGVAVYRNLDQPHFDEREARIAHIILSEVPLLHEAGMPHANSRTMPQLPPRCRLIMNHLVRNQTRKTIAAHLGLSEQTVSGYVKKIFGHFGVHSQAELIARFTRGDGRDG